MSLFRVLLVVALALASGCALTSRGEATSWHWFTPEKDRTYLTSAPATAGPAVRVGSVTSGSDLGRSIVYGDGAYEVGYYEGRRWTERPELYVRRALERTLFQERGFQADLTGNAPSLDVEVLKFEEVKTPGSHAGRVTLRVVLSAGHILFDEKVQAVDPVVGGSFDDVVAAIGRALDAASEDVATRVGAALATSVNRAR